MGKGREVEHARFATRDGFCLAFEMVEALVGCVAGAVLVSETERMAREAGLTEIVLNPEAAYIDGMVDWEDPLYQKIIANLPAETKPSECITSLDIIARKPGATEPARSQAGTPSLESGADSSSGCGCKPDTCCG